MATNGSSVSRQAAPAQASNHQMATIADGPPPPRHVVFILYNLPYDWEDDFPEPEVHGIHEELEDLSEKIAAAYYEAMTSVLESHLNHAGSIQAVYLKVWEKCCFQLVALSASLQQCHAVGI